MHVKYKTQTHFIHYYQFYTAYYTRYINNAHVHMRGFTVSRLPSGTNVVDTTETEEHLSSHTLAHLFNMEQLRSIPFLLLTLRGLIGVLAKFTQQSLCTL